MLTTFLVTTYHLIVKLLVHLNKKLVQESIGRCHNESVEAVYFLEGTLFCNTKRFSTLQNVLWHKQNDDEPVCRFYRDDRDTQCQIQKYTKTHKIRSNKPNNVIFFFPTKWINKIYHLVIYKSQEKKKKNRTFLVRLGEAYNLYGQVTLPDLRGTGRMIKLYIT